MHLHSTQHIRIMYMHNTYIYTLCMYRSTYIMSFDEREVTEKLLDIPAVSFVAFFVVRRSEIELVCPS